MTSSTEDKPARTVSPLAEGLSRRRALLGLGLMSGLAGCSSLKEENLATQHLSLAKNIFFPKKEDRYLQREDVAKYPYASLAIKVGRRPEQLILLNRFEGDKLIWKSGDDIVLVTRHGRLLQTSGLLYNLTGTSFVGEDPIASGLLQSDGQTSIRFFDFAEDYGRVIEAVSTYKVEGRDPIEILGTSLPTVRIREKVRAAKIGWRHKNIYWVHEKSQFVWRTLQHYHPDRPPFLLTVMRPVKLPG